VPNILVPALLAPLGVLALLALFLRGSSRAIVALVVALVGFLTAVAALHVQLATTGSVVAPIWPGTALSLYWLGIVGAAVLALSAIGRAAIYPVWVAILALGVVVIPLAIALPFGKSSVASSDGRTMPAVVTAKAAAQPRVGTLRITPEPGGGVGAELVRGGGETLDVQSTLSSTERGLTSAQSDLANLAGNLASQSGFDATSRMKELGIDFVLLAPPATVFDQKPSEPAKVTSSRASTALDSNPVLVPVGSTAAGQLWAFDRGTTVVPPAARIPTDAGGFWRVIVLVLQGLVIGLTLLLSIPTVRSADRVAELNARRPKRHGRHGSPDEAVAPQDEPEENHEGAVVHETVPDSAGEPAEEAAVEAGDSPAAERAAEPEPEPEPEPTPEPEPEPTREPELVTTPTTLEEGLDETIIRPHREPEGDVRG
jgi:hypothetical protein